MLWGGRSRNKMAKIGFIGMGNMGSALLKGALETFGTEELIFTAKTEQTRQRVTAETLWINTPGGTDLPVIVLEEGE